MTDERLVGVVRRNCRERGCTCGEAAPIFLTAPVGETDMTVVIEHLEGCPLYRDPVALAEVLASGAVDATTILGEDDG